jgi:hypothetical protein
VRGRQYLVAVDPAGGGSGGDNSAIEVLELETGMQCAEFAGHLGAAELAGLVAELARCYNNAWVVVERNNHGSGVLAHLERAEGDLRVYRQNGQAGWLTNSAGVHEPEVAGRVQELCTVAEWQDRGAGGHARRPGDGDGDRTGSTGGDTGLRARWPDCSGVRESSRSGP